jgi:hypothetical protein
MISLTLDEVDANELLPGGLDHERVRRPSPGPSTFRVPASPIPRERDRQPGGEPDRPRPPLRRGVGLHVIEQGIDTTTVEGRAMFGMLSVLAGLQRELIIANTRDGLAAACARGRKGGRRPKLNPDQTALAQQLYNAGDRTVQQIADLFNVSRTTV